MVNFCKNNLSFTRSKEKKYFSRVQMACRKDVECAFGIVQARFSIVCGLARFWDETTLNDIMKACIILHNMIMKMSVILMEYNKVTITNKCLKASLQSCHESVQLKFGISFSPIFTLEIEKLILNSKMISWNTCDNYMVNHKII